MHSLRKYHRIIVTSLLLFALFHTKGASGQIDITQANRLFEEGKFQEAEAIYEEILKKEPENYQAVLSLGRVNLYKNSLEESFHPVVNIVLYD